MARRYDWKPDVADHRDRLFSLMVAAPPTLPKVVPIVGSNNPIEDQGNLGSCTGNSSTSMVEIITGTSQLSRLMAYYNGRVVEGTVTQDSGCTIRGVIKGISKFGVSTEALWPYVIQKFKTKPVNAAVANALTLLPRITSYQRITDLTGLKISLASHNPVTFGFAVPASFESQATATTGWVSLPLANEAIIGGHAVCAVGYDDTAPIPFIWVRNSWGAKWGLKGYFKMDQRWFTDPRKLADDLWTITAVKTVNVQNNRFVMPA